MRFSKRTGTLGSVPPPCSQGSQHVRDQSGSATMSLLAFLPPPPVCLGRDAVPSECLRGLSAHLGGVPGLGRECERVNSASEIIQLGFTWIHLDCWGLHLDFSWIPVGAKLESTRVGWCPERWQFGVQCREHERAYPYTPWVRRPAVPRPATIGFLAF